jgi:hypothetical protein
MSAEVALLWKRSRRLLADYALLAVLDARQAGLQLSVALAAVLAATVLITTAWLACVVAAVGWLDGTAGWPPVLFVAALLNVLAAGVLVWWVRGRIRGALPFAATLRQLRGEAPGQAEDAVHHD